MGLHVDVSHLTQEECQHIVGVIAKDIALRKFDQERVRRLRKDLDDLRRSITLKSSKRSLDSNCQICGRLLLNWCCLFSGGERCLTCEYLACSKCRNVLIDEHDVKSYLCFLCVKKRNLKRQCFDWFYDAVGLRFKRFGSAKVLRGLYRCNKDARVVNLLAAAREIAMSSFVQTSSSRRTSAIKAPFGHSNLCSSSPTTSSLSDAESSGEIGACKSRSTSGIGPLRRSQSLRFQRPQISRKLSAPAMLHSESKAPVELHPKPLEPPLEEKCRDSSENSEFEVIPDEVTQRLSEEPREKETSFTVKIFGEVEFVMLAAITFVLALFLSILSCVGYIDVFYTDSEKEDGQEK